MGIISKSAMEKTGWGLVIILFFTTSALLPQKKRAISANQKKIIRYLNLGTSHFKKGELDQALLQIQKGMKINANFYPFHFLMANILFTQKKYPESLVHMKKAARLFQHQSEIKKGEKFRKINELRAQILDLKSKLTTVAESKCSTNFINNMFDKQIKEKQRQINMLSMGKGKQSVPKIPTDFYYLHANIQLKLKSYPAAKSLYLKTILSSPTHRNGYNNLIALSTMENNPAEALRYITMAKKHGVQLNPQLIQTVQLAHENKLMSQDKSKFPAEIKRFISRFKGDEAILYENTYIYFNPKTKDAVLIDPGAINPLIDKFITKQNLKIRKILNTHGHYDHTAANRYYADRYQTTIAIHKADRSRFDKYNQKNRPNEFFTEDNFKPVPNIPIRIIHNAGHTAGSCSFLIGANLFSGDALMKHAVGSVTGNTDLEKNNQLNKLIRSIKKNLLSLPQNTKVFPGHGQITTILSEKTSNPFLNRKLAIRQFQHHFGKLESVKNISEVNEPGGIYDLKLTFDSPDGVHAFKKKFGNTLIGLKLKLVSIN